MAQKISRHEIKLPVDHPALVIPQGMVKQERLIELIEKGLLYEELVAKQTIFNDCLAQLQSLVKNVPFSITREPTVTNQPEATSDCGISPEKQRQALALMESFGIDLLS